MEGTHAAHTQCPCSLSGTGRTPLGSCPHSCSSHCTLTLRTGEGTHSKLVTGTAVHVQGSRTQCAQPALVLQQNQPGLPEASNLLPPLGATLAHLGSPRSWEPASHQHRCTDWVGSRSPHHRRAYRRLAGQRGQQSGPGPKPCAIPTPSVLGRGSRFRLLGPEPQSGKDRDGGAKVLARVGVSPREWVQILETRMGRQTDTRKMGVGVGDRDREKEKD